jgi:hypothetical protein
MLAQNPKVFFLPFTSMSVRNIHAYRCVMLLCYCFFM